MTVWVKDKTTVVGFRADSAVTPPSPRRPHRCRIGVLEVSSPIRRKLRSRQSGLYACAGQRSLCRDTPVPQVAGSGSRGRGSSEETHRSPSRSRTTAGYRPQPTASPKKTTVSQSGASSRTAVKAGRLAWISLSQLRYDTLLVLVRSLLVGLPGSAMRFFTDARLTPTVRAGERSLRRRRFGVIYSHSVVTAGSVSTVSRVGLEAEAMRRCHHGSSRRLAPVYVHGTACTHLCDGVGDSQSDPFAHQPSPISGDAVAPPYCILRTQSVLLCDGELALVTCPLRGLRCSLRKEA